MHTKKWPQAHRSQRLACRILRELAREPLVIYELLKAGVAEYVSRLLPKLRLTSTDRLLEVSRSKRAKKQPTKPVETESTFVYVAC